MPKQNSDNLIAFRLDAEELAAWEEVCRRAWARNPLASKAIIARQLFGLKNELEHHPLVTEEDRHLLLGASEANKTAAS